ncbi:hypothetical protein VCHENC02_3699, partial [Vibrio harveyi]
MAPPRDGHFAPL